MRASNVVSRTAVLALISALAASPLAAQTDTRTDMPDSAQLSRVMTNGRQLMQPARFILDHRAELGLTEDQVTRLEALAAAQRDSEPVRQRRLMGIAMSSYSTPRVMMSWTGPMSEDSIRAETLRSAETQAESMINVTRDRHAVGAVLTPTQLALIPRLEAALMSGMGRTAAPKSGSTAPAMPEGEGHPYFEFQVEKPVTTLPKGAPKYPEELLAARVSGEVLAQFVVDTLGRFEPGSYRVLRSDHQRFTEAVRDALPGMHFLPAEVGGRKVRQLVQQPFLFTPDQK